MKPIKGYEGYYTISKKGVIKSLPRGGTSGKVLKQSNDKDGYKRVMLSKNGKTKTYMVHRLVAETFLKNKDSKLTVDHIDRDKTNNNVSNLRWATHGEQQKYIVDDNNKKKISTESNVVLYWE